jgi:hypothetical protein
MESLAVAFSCQFISDPSSCYSVCILLLFHTRNEHQEGMLDEEIVVKTSSQSHQKTNNDATARRAPSGLLLVAVLFLAPLALSW